MIKAIIPLARKVFGLFVDDGSLAVSLLLWITALHVLVSMKSIEQGGLRRFCFWAASAFPAKICSEHHEGRLRFRRHCASGPETAPLHICRWRPGKSESS